MASSTEPATPPPLTSPPTPEVQSAIVSTLQVPKVRAGSVQFPTEYGACSHTRPIGLPRHLPTRSLPPLVPFSPGHCLSSGLFPEHPNHLTGSLLLPDTFRKPGSNYICPCSSFPAAPHGSPQSQALGSRALEGLASVSPPPSTPVSSTLGQTGSPPFPQLHSFTPKILSLLFTRGAQSPEGLLFNRC